MIKLIQENISHLEEKLATHSLYKAITNIDKLKFFMEHHVFSVWDFMGLVKFLQQKLAPSHYPWTPPQDIELARFINEIVLAEESDIGTTKKPLSHFEMYCEAMAEVQANSDLPLSFVRHVEMMGLEKTFQEFPLPKPAQTFMNKTHELIQSQSHHQVASYFAFGREKIIPSMFQQLLTDMNISSEDAPTFHYYLKRHIDLDGDHHGPMALKMVSYLCDDDEKKWKEANDAAVCALESRIEFWDDIEKEMRQLSKL